MLTTVEHKGYYAIVEYTFLDVYRRCTERFKRVVQRDLKALFKFLIDF